MFLLKFIDLISNLFTKNYNNSTPIPSEPTSNLPTVSQESNSPAQDLNIINMLNLPERKPDAITGSQFIANNLNLAGSLREANILKEILDGNIPDFLRKFASVDVSDQNNKITLYVLPNYLSIGSDDDYCLMPMYPGTAQKIADACDCLLPTVKMVDLIYQNAVNKLAAKPHGPPYDSSMESTDRFNWSNNVIKLQMIGKDKSALTAGHKKDVVISNKLHPNNFNKRVDIYGWFDQSGNVIQKENPVSHVDHYSDYAHGIRLISNNVKVNDQMLKLTDVFDDKDLSKLLNYDGILKFKKY